jgi:tetratricopeptide (TPR) repeat protein
LSLKEKMPPTIRNNYLVITPKEAVSQLHEESIHDQVLPSELEFTNDFRDLLELFALAQISVYQYNDTDPVKAASYYKEMLGLEKFKSLPRFFQVEALRYVAWSFESSDNYNEALKLLLEANEINYEFDQPEGSWPGIELVWTDRVQEPVVLDRNPSILFDLSRVYERVGDMENSANYLKSAREMLLIN